MMTCAQSLILRECVLSKLDKYHAHGMCGISRSVGGDIHSTMWICISHFMCMLYVALRLAAFCVCNVLRTGTECVHSLSRSQTNKTTITHARTQRVRNPTVTADLTGLCVGVRSVGNARQSNPHHTQAHHP